MYVGGGLAVGLAGAWVLATLVSGFLFQVQPRDPRVFAGAAAALLVAGIMAAYVPARRAASADPLVALRMD